ncbi:MAG: hypothetical protein R2715_14970 [Ilumatobacteraceae bacterium]
MTNARAVAGLSIGLVSTGSTWPVLAAAPAEPDAATPVVGTPVLVVGAAVLVVGAAVLVADDPPPEQAANTSTPATANAAPTPLGVDESPVWRTGWFGS